MKKFNKVTTVKMEVDAEVLPLNTVFVARMMQAKQTLQRRNEILLNYKDAAMFEPEFVMAAQADISGVLDFFHDLYAAMTEEDKSEK